MVQSFELPEDRLFIAGEWRQGRGAEIVSHFPADGSLNRVLHGASVEEDFCAGLLAAVEVVEHAIAVAGRHHRHHQPHRGDRGRQRRGRGRRRHVPLYGGITRDR